MARCGFGAGARLWPSTRSGVEPVRSGPALLRQPTSPVQKPSNKALQRMANVRYAPHAFAAFAAGRCEIRAPSGGERIELID